MAQPVVWWEIHGKDGAKSQKFYSDLFGWKVNADNPMQYGMVDGAQVGGVGGGITTAQGGPMVTIYVEVADLDAALKKAESLGGKTLMPAMDVPGGPTIALFADPDGNTVGLTKAGTMG